MADFFREVDEDVRRDQAIQLWKKYQNWVIGAALIIVAATAGWRVYDYFRLKAGEAAGSRYEAALQLLQNGTDGEADKQFRALAKDGPYGYATLARLGAADAIAAKDPAAGIGAYDAVAEDPRVEPTYQDIARLRAAYLRIDREDPKKFEARYAPFADPERPYRNFYRELLALAAFKSGDFDSAGRWLDEIAMDPSAPPALRGRAGAFLELVQAGKLPN
ncbi:MAG TPA: tetratricopeptide repeat protein [Methylovirgula sp.]|nr:tetratricopeptide repeat protein [Methylovirgula sp.]